MTMLYQSEKPAIHRSMQVWICKACGGQDHKSCGCNSEARAEELAAKKEAQRQRNRAHMAEKRKAEQNQQPVDNPLHVENIEDFPSASAEARKNGFNCEDDDLGDDDQTIWRRGLAYRATNAIGEAKYEDWSKFTVDRELVTLAEQAAEAWIKTAKYLKELL